MREKLKIYRRYYYKKTAYYWLIGINLILYLLSSYFLACFKVLFAEYSRFCFRGSLTIGFAIVEAKSKNKNIIVGFSK